MIDGPRTHRHTLKAVGEVLLAPLMSYVRSLQPTPSSWRVETRHHGLIAYMQTYWTLLLQRTVVDDDDEAGDHRRRNNI